MLKKIALAATFAALLSSASAQTDPFVMYKSYGTYDLSFNPQTTTVLGATPRLGLVMTDQRMRMSPPQRVPDSTELLSMTINTVLVDCANNKMTILVARAYNPAGKQFSLRTAPLTVDNPNMPGHSHTETISVVCASLAEVLKKSESDDQPAQRQPL